MMYRAISSLPLSPPPTPPPKKYDRTCKKKEDREV